MKIKIPSPLEVAASTGEKNKSPAASAKGHLSPEGEKERSSDQPADQLISSQSPAYFSISNQHNNLPACSRARLSLLEQGKQKREADTALSGSRSVRLCLSFVIRSVCLMSSRRVKSLESVQRQNTKNKSVQIRRTKGHHHRVNRQEHKSDRRHHYHHPAAASPPPQQ